MEHIIHEFFPPHSECWLWRWDIILTHLIGDALTALAYYAIPIILFYLTRKYYFDVRLKLILYIYATFIFLCGTTHIFDVLMIWYVDETVLLLDGTLRVVTGVFSVFSATVTFYVTWKFLIVAKEFFGITAQMTKERDHYNRVQSETWDEFEKTVSSMKQALERTTE